MKAARKKARARGPSAASDTSKAAKTTKSAEKDANQRELQRLCSVRFQSRGKAAQQVLQVLRGIHASGCVGSLHTDLDKFLRSRDDPVQFTFDVLDCLVRQGKVNNGSKFSVVSEWLGRALVDLVDTLPTHSQQPIVRSRVDEQLCSRQKFFSGRLWVKLAAAYGLQFSTEHHIRHIRFRLEESDVRGAFHLITAYDLLEHFTYAQLKEILTPLAKSKHSHKINAFLDLLPSAMRPQAIRVVFESGFDAKLTLRLVHRFNLNVANYEDIEAAAKFPGLRWLVKTGKAAEFGIDMCGKNQALQVHLLVLLFRARYFQLFRQFAEHFGLCDHGKVRKMYLKVSCCPHKFPPEDPRVSCKQQLDEDGNEVTEFLSLKVPVSWIGRGDDIQEARRHFFSGKVAEVGVDLEFKPSFCNAHSTERAAVIQIASSCCVFVFDLMGDLRPELADFFQTLFSDRSIVKIGYSFKSDIRVLRNSFPSHHCFDVMQPVLDLTAVEKHLPEPQPHSIGLSRLSRKILGFFLCKDEQISNWERRPLRASQLTYCALDAHCLISITRSILAQKIISSTAKASSSTGTGGDIDEAALVRMHTSLNIKSSGK